MLNKTAIGNFLPVKFLRQTSSNFNYVPVSWGSFGHSTFSQSTQRIHMVPVPHNFVVSPLIFFNFRHFDEIFLVFSLREVSLSQTSVQSSSVFSLYFKNLPKLDQKVPSSITIKTSLWQKLTKLVIQDWENFVRGPHAVLDCQRLTSKQNYELIQKFSRFYFRKALSKKEQG